MVEHGIVVTEPNVVSPDALSLILFRKNLTRLENLGDEHRPLTLGRRRQKVKILPDRSADCARNAHVVLESGPAFRHRFLDELFDDCAAFRPKQAMVRISAVRPELVCARGVSDDQSAKSLVADQDVGTEAKDEVGYTDIPRG